MNGRVYDPTLGRFLSADPHVQIAGATQACNRYSYVNNNPLSYTDPSGFFFKKIKKAARSVLTKISKAYVGLPDPVKVALLGPFAHPKINQHPLGQAIGFAVIGIAGGPYAPALASAYSAIITLEAGGSPYDALWSAATSYHTQSPSREQGDGIGFWSPEHLIAVARIVFDHLADASDAAGSFVSRNQDDLVFGISLGIDVGIDLIAFGPSGEAVPITTAAIFAVRPVVTKIGPFLQRFSNSLRNITNTAGSIEPFGFRIASFSRFSKTLNSGLMDAGFAGTRALLQGSAVTGRNLKTGRAFDVGKISDFDIALAGPDIFAKAKQLGIGLRSQGTRTGPLNAAQVQQLGLGRLQATLSSMAGRPVNFMIFDDAAKASSRAPSIGF